MTESDISIISRKIDEEKEYLEFLSQQIWENPELKFEETFAHALLTEALMKYGFVVQKHYFLPTAFRGEFCSSANDGPTIAIVCEYDALPDIGHGCGHNLIAESGIAAGMAVKTAMEADCSIHGKIVVLGTPAEEGGSGKGKLLKHGAFNDIDVVLMAHPSNRGTIYSDLICLSKVTVTYTGKKSHAYPWEGNNALDAAVACYNGIALLRQQMKPTCRIHGIITKGGAAPNIIPSETEMKFFIRASTNTELVAFQKKVIPCFHAAALPTDCDVEVNFTETDLNVIGNRVLLDTFKECGELFGLKFRDPCQSVNGGGSTDLGNVSHSVPSMHPFFGIGSNYTNHSKNFTKQAATAEAQIATLAVSKALALVAVKLMKDPELIQDMKNAFHEDLAIEST